MLTLFKDDKNIILVNYLKVKTLIVAKKYQEAYKVAQNIRIRNLQQENYDTLYTIVALVRAK
jgi:hypothetical protein